MLIFAFAKNEQDNIDQEELPNLPDVAAKWLATSSRDLAKAVAAGEIEEIENAHES